MSVTKICKQTFGTMTPLWNILDRLFPVAYIYTFTMKKDEIKGVYCHKKRTGYIHLLLGSVKVFYRDYGDDEFKSIILRESQQNIECAKIDKMTEYYLTTTQNSVLINVCDYPYSEHEAKEMTKETINDTAL